MRKTLFILLLTLATIPMMADETAKLQLLLPKPVSVTAIEGTFTGNISNATVQIVSDEELGLFNHNIAGFPNEGYKLSVTPTGISITAASEVGVIRAKQTLYQLCGNTEENAEETFPCCDIIDYPAFKVRGYMHDIGRSFISVEELKREIDLLARFKVNVFHWHLTDHHAFRFESKKQPSVNKNFTNTRWPNDYYTQEQCHDIMQYATERGMIIIPEIDMPGHSTSFTTATGVKMVSEEGKAILKDVLSEVAEVFTDAPYIHIGGDETSDATISYINEMADYVRSLGKKVVIWNQYGAGSTRASVDASTLHVDMTTNWATSGRLSAGIPNIDMRYNYNNHFDVFADLAGIYRSNIFYEKRGTDEVAGSISGMWNDRLVDSEEQIIAQNNFYANVLATAERAWIGGGEQYIEKGGAYLPNGGSEYEEFADWERRFLHYKSTWLSEVPIPYVKQCNVRWSITPAYNNGGSSAKKFDIESATELTPTAGSITATGAGIWLNHIWAGTVNGVLGCAQSMNQTRYAWTYVYSEVEQTVGAQIEFYNYSRSDAGKMPAYGKWDLMGSKVWINDVALTPNWQWTSQGQDITSLESPLGNVNFPARKPLKVTLKQGWNKILIKCPYVNAGQKRTNKWQFTFVFTDIEGKNAVEGLIYSPNKLMSAEAESVFSLMQTITTDVANKCSDALGYYAVSYAEDINLIIEEVRDALTKADADYTTLTKELNEAYDQFLTSLNTAKVNLPQASTSTSATYYTITTPLRSGYYVTSSGKGSIMTSVANESLSSYWKFVNRGNDTFDIINYNDGGYISPTSSNNSGIKCVSNRPSSGWTLAPAATIGYFVIGSGSSVQLNQTNSGLGNKLYNWGTGTQSGSTYNTNDTGCQFFIAEVEVPDAISSIMAPNVSTTRTFDLQGRHTTNRRRGIYIVNNKKVAF